MTVEQQKSFAKKFGKLTTSPIAQPRIPEHPEVSVFSNIKVDGHDVGARPDRSFGDAWHSDFSFMKEPASASFFYAEKVPKAGGDDTWYANTTMAYEMLPKAMKTKLEGLSWTYSYLKTMQQHAHDFSPTTHARVFNSNSHELCDVTHPFVRTHPETRKKALFIGIPDTRDVLVKDMTKEEGVKFLEELKSFATRQEFTYAHKWQAGDAILWDNRCTMHRASVFPDTNGNRLCYRLTTNGGVPF